MNLRKSSHHVVWGSLVIFLLVGCGASEPQPEMIEVTFNGNGCAVSGLTDLPPGDHSILYKDMTEEQMVLYVYRIVDGHTFQDMVDAQSEPGDLTPYPDWVRQQPMIDQTWDEALGGEVHTFGLEKEGTYAIILLSRKNLWTCTPLQIIGESSG